MFANLIGSIAIACAVAFGGAVPDAKQKQIDFGAETTSVKSRHFDSSGNYGTTGNTFYNYLDYSMCAFMPDDMECVNPAIDPSGSIAFEIEDGEIDFLYNGYTGYPLYLIGDLAPGDTISSSSESLVYPEIAVYVNGEFKNKWVPDDSDGYGVLMYATHDLGADSYEFVSGDYVWIFEYNGEGAEPESTNIVGDVVEGLTGGIVPIAEGLGFGFQDLTRNIFLVGHVDATTNEWVADGLSTFGIITICFAGLALALGLSRWIVNFVGSLGARDR